MILNASDKFVCSQDGETFEGLKPMREAALAQAQMDADNENDPGTAVTLRTGREQTPAEILRSGAAHIGGRIKDLVAEYVTEDIGSEDLALSIDPAQHQELGLLIADWVEKNAVTLFYGVKDVQSHQYTTQNPKGQSS